MSKSLLFGDLCTRAWLKHWKGTKNAPSQASILKKLRFSFGEERRVHLITTSLIERMSSRWLNEGASAKTCNRRLSCLSKMLRWAERRGELEKMPYIERHRESAGRMRTVSDSEEATMLAGLLELGHPEYADIVACLVDTGMRREELLSLGWDQIVDGWVSLEDTKSGRPRRIPLTQRAAKILMGYPVQSHNLGVSGPFESVAKSSFSAAWNKVKHSMSIDDKAFVPHALRHTFASRLLMRGVDIFTVSKLLGHTSIKTTADVYGHLSPDRAADAVALLEPEGADSGH